MSSPKKRIVFKSPRREVPQAGANTNVPGGNWNKSDLCSSRRWALVLLILTACSRPSPPPLPVVDTSAFLPAVREEIDGQFAAVRAAPKDPEQAGRLGMLLHAHDRFEAALACYRRAHLLQPDDYRWLYLSGAVEANLSRTEEAASSFRKALGHKPEDVPSKLGLAEALLASGRHSESRTLFQELLSKQPALTAALYGTAKTYEAEGNLQRAAQLYEQACQQYPRYGAAHYALALVYRKLGRTADADAHLAAYEQNRSSSPPREDPLLASVRSMNRGILPLLAAAKKAAAAGRLQEAVNLHLQALSIDPNQEQTHINLISLYGRLRQQDKAEHHYREAIAKNAGRDEAHYNYAVLMSETGRFDEARVAYRTALELNPGHAEANNNLAYLLAQQRRFDEALAYVNKALSSRPGYPQAHYNAAMILLARGRPHDAIPHLEAAIRAGDSNAARYMQALAEAYRRAGDLNKAREYTQRAQDGLRSAR